MSVKRIGVLTSGGDAPGMNAAIRGVVRAAIEMGIEVYGIRRGYNGLLNRDFEKMEIRSVSNTIQRGGTFLYTARSKEFNSVEGVAKAAEICREEGIDGLVVIGGDGSFRGARDLTNAGIPCVGIPGTIDNDIAASEYTIGFDSAMNTAMEMIDKLRDTSESHDRCSVVEVMGRKCGDIALNVSIATGAITTLVPEVEWDLQEDVIGRIQKARLSGKRHFIVVVAEGVGGVEELAKQIESSVGIETRATVLGHVQRGGSPTLRDRLVGNRMGFHAVKILKEGKSDRVVILKEGEIEDMDITKALNKKRLFNEELYEISRILSN